MTFMPHRLTCQFFAPSRCRGLFFLLATLYSLFVTSSAYAACSSPAGTAGKIIYNADQKVVQYCDNTNWIPAGFPGSGSGGCSSPARAEGTIIYNADNAVMQFCGGSVWVPMAQPGSADITTSLLGHWKLDESSGTTAADSSGNGWTATQYNSGPTWAPTGGNVDGAALFSPVDGNSDTTKPHLTLGTGFDIPAMPFTIAAWVNPTDYNDFRGIIGKRIWYSPQETRFFLQLISGTGTVTLQGGSTASQADFYYSPPTGQWTHLAVVASATSSDLYVNGAFQESATAISLGTLASGAYANIGDNGEVESQGGSVGDGDPWKGYLDDVRVYGRALSAVDIAMLANSFPGDCYGPNGYKGELIYNSTKTMLQYCNGASWVAVGKNAGSYASDMVGYWKFDEASGTSAADSSGNGLTGTLTNSLVWQPTAGKVDGALDFGGPGANGYVTVADPGTGSSLDFAPGSSITVAVWAKTFLTGCCQALVTKGGTGGTRNMNWSLQTDVSNALSFGFHDSGGTWQGMYANGVVVPGTWQFYAATFTFGGGASVAKLYVDGQPVAPSEQNSFFTATPVQSNDPLWIGADNHPGTIVEHVQGLIDEVRVYNRALAPSEILDLYNNTNGTPGAGTGVAFVTSTTYNGNLGGVAGADAICQARASAAGLSGTFKAWISSAAANQPSSTFTHSSVGYWTPNGIIIANSWADLTDGTLDAAINVDEAGNQRSAATNVWTNVTTAGAIKTDANANDCTNWSTGANVAGGERGSSSSATGTWTNNTAQNCNNTKRLYCFQQ